MTNDWAVSGSALLSIYVIHNFISTWGVQIHVSQLFDCSLGFSSQNESLWDMIEFWMFFSPLPLLHTPPPPRAYVKPSNNITHEMFA